MQLTADESVKSEINEDMSLVPNEYIDAEFDEVTGEVIE